MWWHHLAFGNSSRLVSFNPIPNLPHFVLFSQWSPKKTANYRRPSNAFGTRPKSMDIKRLTNKARGGLRSRRREKGKPESSASSAETEFFRYNVESPLKQRDEWDKKPSSDVECRRVSGSPSTSQQMQTDGHVQKKGVDETDTVSHTQGRGGSNMQKHKSIEVNSKIGPGGGVKFLKQRPGAFAVCSPQKKISWLS